MSKKWTLWLVSLSLLGGCSFKKNSSKDSSTPTLLTQDQERPPQNIFEALRAKDASVFLSYLDRAQDAEINSYDSEGLTPLYIATRLQNLDFVEALLRHHAIPLMPNRKSEQSAYTLALKIGGLEGGITRSLQQNINEQKATVAHWLDLGLFAEALKKSREQYLDLKTPLRDEEAFLDLMTRNSAENPALAESLATELLAEGSCSEATTMALWKLSFDRHAAGLRETLIRSGSLPAEDALRTMLQGSEISWTLSTLAALNSAGVKPALDLKLMQNRYLHSLLSQPASHVLSEASIKSDLFLLAANAGRKELCTTCVERLLGEKKFLSSRAAIIQDLIATADEVPADFLAGLVTRISTAEIRVILGSMSREQIRGQSGVLGRLLREGHDADLPASYKLLREFSLRLSANEGHELLNTLINAHLQGDENAARKLLLISDELLALRKEMAVPSRDLQEKASREALQLNDKNVTDTLAILSLLEKLNGDLFEGILVNREVDGAKYELMVDAGYYLFWARNEQPRGFSLSSITTSELQFQHIFSSNRFAIEIYPEQKSMNDISIFVESLSTHDLIMLSTLASFIKDDVAAGQKETLTNSFKIIRSFLISSLQIDTNRGFELAVSYWKALSSLEQSASRNLFLPLLLKIQTTPASLDWISRYISDMNSNFRDLDKNYSDLIAEKILTLDTYEHKFVDILKVYFKKQSPRFFYAISTNQLAQLRDFIKGNLSSDPICKGGAIVTNLEAILHTNLSQIDKNFLNQRCQGYKNFETDAPFIIPDNPSLPSNIRIQQALQNMKNQRDFKKSRNHFISQQTANDVNWALTINKIFNKIGDKAWDNLGFDYIKSSELPIDTYNNSIGSENFNPSPKFPFPIPGLEN